MKVQKSIRRCCEGGSLLSRVERMWVMMRCQRRKEQCYRPTTMRVNSKDSIDRKELDPAEEYDDALGVQAMGPPVEQIPLPAFWVTPTNEASR